MRAVDVLADLEARGLVHDSTDRDTLRERLSSRPVVVYYGCDPTSDSFHIGHLVGILVLRRLQAAGHRPIALAGGATGMVGDPTGRSTERVLLDEDELAANLAGIQAQLGQLLETGGPDGARLVDNAEWTAGLSLLEFLRDVGRHAPVNVMLARESVKARLESGGLTFTEFSYPLIQANDYLELHRQHGCELQIGGSDQWGNITAGVDLVRRVTGDAVHAFTWPLVLRSDGRKFAKSEGDNVWLSAEKTSPYAFYQYWLNVPDADVRRFLLQLTLLPVEEAEAVATASAGDPAARMGQRRLARELTGLVHGAAATAAAEAASAVVFGADLDEVAPEALALLDGELDTTALPRDRLSEGIDLVGLLAEVGLVPSRAEARRRLDQGGVYVANRRVDPEKPSIDLQDVRGGRYVLLGLGRKRHHLLRVEGSA
jgi:tyrosyl-tRNA synthetase